MKYLLTMFLFAGLLAGCSAAPALENATQAVSTVGNHASASTTNIPAAEATKMDTTEGPKPNAITVRPPNVPVAPIQGTPGFPLPTASPLAGWQMFTSATLGVAVDYPMGWSVTENNTGVTFTASQGQPILLQVDQGSGSASTSGQECSTVINTYGQPADVCHDAATASYRAVFKNSADASKPALILSTTSQATPTVFLHMLDSFRFTP